MAVPNAQYASMKYAAFDGRDHVGLGGWHSCSSMYKESMQWAPGPVSCNTTEMEYLAGTALADCGSDGFVTRKRRTLFTRIRGLPLVLTAKLAIALSGA